MREYRKQVADWRFERAAGGLFSDEEEPSDERPATPPPAPIPPGVPEHLPAGPHQWKEVVQVNSWTACVELCM